MTSHGKQTHWVWNLEDIDIDDPTREIQRLTKKCERMVIKYQNIIRHWFYTSQNIHPLKWLCEKKILKPVIDSRGCLRIKDKNLDQLIQYEDNGVKKIKKQTQANSEHDEL